MAADEVRPELLLWITLWNISSRSSTHLLNAEAQASAFIGLGVR